MLSPPGTSALLPLARPLALTPGTSTSSKSSSVPKHSRAASSRSAGTHSRALRAERGASGRGPGCVGAWVPRQRHAPCRARPAATLRCTAALASNPSSSPVGGRVSILEFIAAGVISAQHHIVAQVALLCCRCRRSQRCCCRRRDALRCLRSARCWCCWPCSVRLPAAVGTGCCGAAQGELVEQDNQQAAAAQQQRPQLRQR